MKRLLIILLIIPIMLTSCWDQLIIEKTGFMLIYGVESGKNDEYLATIAFPPVGTTNENQIEIISVEFGISREAREEARRIASQSIVGGKTQEIFFSEELARKGIKRHFDVFERDASNPSLANVVVVDGSPNELISKISNVKERRSSPLYVHQLIEERSEDSAIPKLSIYQFNVKYYTDGLDPIAPLVKLQDNSILVLGSALFYKDKMVGRINTRDSVVLHAMMNELDYAQYIFESQEVTELLDSEMAMQFNNCKRKLDIKIENNVPVISISLTLSGSISDYKWDELGDKAKQNQIEKTLSQQIENHCNKLIKYIQQTGCDPIGLGNMVRAKYNKYWKSTDWEHAYKEAKINVTAKVKFIRYGTIK